MYNNKSNVIIEAIKHDDDVLCIKIRDNIKRYCGDDISQYIDLLNDSAILHMIKLKNTTNIEFIAIKFIYIIFQVKIKKSNENYKKQVILEVDYKYNIEQLISKIKFINMQSIQLSS